MICWSCESDSGATVLCTRCKAIQPPERGVDAFAVFGMEPAFVLDEAALERRYRDLSRILHPDRHARSDPRARRWSLERSVQLNEAYRTLRDPVRRAEYLVQRAGVAVAPSVPPELLAEILELREQLQEAKSTHDHVRLETLRADMRGRATRGLEAITRALQAGTPAGVEEAARELSALRYVNRFLDDIAAHDEVAADRLRTGGRDAR